jgi:hypothetical protein
VLHKNIWQKNSTRIKKIVWARFQRDNTATPGVAIAVGVALVSISVGTPPKFPETRGHEEILVGNGEAFFFPLELLFPGGDSLGPPFACGAFVYKECTFICILVEASIGSFS